jgi:hypothetical protein
MRQRCNSRDCTADLGHGDIARGMRLCKSCRGRLARHLALLPELYRACENALDARRYTFAPRTSRRSPEGLRLNELAIRVRADIAGVLSSWVLAVAEELSVPGPPKTGIGSLAAFLRHHLDWLAAHTGAADVAEEIAQLVAAAGKVLEPPTSRVELGPCVEDDCDQVLRARIHAGNGKVTHEIGCDAGHTWQLHQWLLLSHRIEQLKSAT